MADTVQYILKLKDQLTPVLEKANKTAKRLNKNLAVGPKNLNKGLRTSSKQVSRLKKQTGGLGASLRTLGPALGAVAIVAGIRSTLVAFDKQQQAIAQVRQGLLSTGNQVGKSLGEITKSAQKLQNETLFGDEDILQNVSAQLLTFTNITGENFDRTQKAVADVTTRLFGASASGEQLRSTSIQLGKALNDPVANLSALSRSGIQFTKEQKEVIKALVDGGKAGEAQALILGELEKQYGGSAAAAAEAGLGPFKQFQNIVGDIAEDIGGSLIPIFKALLKPIRAVAIFFQNNFANIKEVFAPLLSIFKPIQDALARVQEQFGGVGDAGTILENIFNAIGTVLLFLEPAFIAIGEIIGEFIFQIVRVGKVIADFIKGNERLQKIIKGIASAGIAVFKQLAKVAKSALGGIGDLLVGIFTGNIETIKAGLAGLGDVILEGNVIALGKSAFDGFQKGFEDQGSISDFFSTDAADGPGGTGAGQGGAAAPKAPGATGAITGDVSGATGSRLTNINININKLVEQLIIKTERFMESPERVRDEMTKALLTAVNDVNIIQGS